jgi:hypothetical protein
MENGQMNQQRRIEQLELALLHLVRSVNDLVDAVETARAEARGGPIKLPGDSLHSDPESALRAAKEHIKEALDTIAEPV